MKARLENFKIAKDTMATEKELQQKLRAEKQTADEELHKIMVNLERLKIEEVDLKEVIIYLQQGIQQLAKVQIAWRNIVQFFNKIKNRVEGPLIGHIQGMIKNADIIIQKGEKSVNDYQRGILYREITKACVVANVLMQSAELYKKISDEHVMPIIDQSILNIGLSKESARAAVKDTIEEHGQALSKNVYDGMREQGFDVGRAIEYRKNRRN
uniref:Uncharacterized protein n=1 Tax=Panagrolaimus davidi TaxID=227884 RepID=A0A914QJF4_9BILA